VAVDAVEDVIGGEHQLCGTEAGAAFIPGDRGRVDTVGWTRPRSE
jgi:hypothetical protein